MVEISMFGSGEGPVWATGRGYSTTDTVSDRQEHDKDVGPVGVSLQKHNLPRHHLAARFKRNERRNAFRMNRHADCEETNKDLL